MIEMKKFAVFLVIILLFLNTVNLWVASKSSFNIVLENPLRSASQILALLGIVFMSLTIVLSAKIKMIEKMLGGLGEVYRIHHIIGSAAFIFIINHPLLLVIQALPQAKLAMIYLFPSLNFVYNFGVAGLYLMVLAFICMVFLKLSYNKWKFTHKFLIPAFVSVSIHALLVGSDLSTFFFLRIWIGFFIAIGVFSIIYYYFFNS